MSRIGVRKTYKLFVGGGFPRSESGRTYPALDHRAEVIARVAAGTRKDLRHAVRCARRAQDAWAGRSGYNRGQILYRIAEMVEDRAPTFSTHLRDAGLGGPAADREVARAVDRLVWYAGWADKYQQVLGNLNPVSGPFFNISTPEPTGVVGVIAPEEPALLGLVSRIAPVVVSGNTTVVLASERWPIPAITLAEAMATADVPGGVVNLLTGPKAAMVPYLASHLDVNAIDAFGADPQMVTGVEEAAAGGVKRVVPPPGGGLDWADNREAQSPYFISSFTEIKTVWHPKGL
ncbi:MAG: aldehyde dehydrogenase family protein [bacterium]|nr:aldehyde dehydrogenase family protein [bacterium]MDE0287759.1 aldehyde dehydrogenase family protein [bacterium]MDE0437446.1 aldehyde dehydrogenase family protein [bacterium]